MSCAAELPCLLSGLSWPASKHCHMKAGPQNLLKVYTTIKTAHTACLWRIRCRAETESVAPGASCT